MSSVRAIAKQVGVSITTVSRALNNDPAVNPATRERVIRAANRCGYTASVGKRVMSSIGLCYTNVVTVSDHFDATVLGGITRGIDERGFDLVILNMQRDIKANENYTQFFRRKGVRGVLIRTIADSHQVCVDIANEEFPHVVISDRFDEPRVNYVDCDSRVDTTRATEYLISLGHQRIAFSMHNTRDRDHLDRLAGYREGLKNQNIEFDERLVLRHPYTTEGGAAAMNMAATMRPRPTAIVFADPQTSIGAVKRAYELGVRIPDDMSIVGFDDRDARRAVYPTMTAVCQDAARLGYEAARWLTRNLDAPANGGLRRTFPTFFEVNQTTAPPGRSGSRALTA
ncbi:MAG: LacI family DNA-binding transcriptional regulator [Phycisphaerae bacterium]|nr:LacI family DNA-binding transcriptional regulator [Phycisphaerae bacterium]